MYIISYNNQATRELNMKTLCMMTAGIVLLMLTGGCAGQRNLGSLDEAHEVTSSYRSFQVNETYNYFYYGVEQLPKTIMGIDRAYRVQSEFWTPVELTPTLLETWVTRAERTRLFDDFASRYQGRYQGAYILDPEGKRIGSWYSRLDWGVFEFPEPGVVIPYVPSLRPGSELRRPWYDD